MSKCMFIIKIYAVTCKPQGTFFFFSNLLFLAVLGLCYCAWAFSSCGERGLLFVVECRLLIAVASLAAEHRL